MHDQIECSNCHKWYYPENGKCPYCSRSKNTIDWLNETPNLPALFSGRVEGIRTVTGLDIDTPKELRDKKIYLVGTTSTFSEQKNELKELHPQARPKEFTVVIKNEYNPIYNPQSSLSQYTRQTQSQKTDLDIQVAISLQNDIRNVQKDISENPEKYKAIPDEILQELKSILGSFEFIDRNRRKDFLKGKRNYFDWFNKNKGAVLKSLPLLISITERLFGVMI